MSKILLIGIVITRYHQMTTIVYFREKVYVSMLMCAHMSICVCIYVFIWALLYRLHKKYHQPALEINSYI